MSLSSRLVLGLPHIYKYFEKCCRWKTIGSLPVNDYHELAFLGALFTYKFYCTYACYVCKFLFRIQEIEKDVKTRTKGELGAAKTLCTPFEQPELPEGMALWGPECKLPMGFLWYNCCIIIFSNIDMLTCLVQPKFRYPVLCIWKASKEVVVLGPQLLIAFAGSPFGFSSEPCNFEILDTNRKIHLHCFYIDLQFWCHHSWKKAIDSSGHYFRVLMLQGWEDIHYFYWCAVLPSRKNASYLIATHHTEKSDHNYDSVRKSQFLLFLP